MSLKPYRQYSEASVINGLFCFRNQNSADSGTIVRISSNYKDANDENMQIFSNLSNIDNSLSALIGPVGAVETMQFFDDPYRPIGIILKSVATEDENGNLLIYNQRKAAEMDVILPNHQSIPILTQGIICVNNIDTADHTVAGGGNPNPGDTAYVGDNGSFATDGIIPVGQFLSSLDAEGYVLIRIQF